MTSIESTVNHQLGTSLSIGKGRPAATALYQHYWPPVAHFAGLNAELTDFIDSPADTQKRLLAGLRHDATEHGRFLHENLAELYAYNFGYRDGACTADVDDAQEIGMFRARVALERELFDHWMTPEPVPHHTHQLAAADYLDELAETNPGVGHPLFDFLRDEADPVQLLRFLQADLIRNEVVDDEVAMLVVGLQGTQKAVAAANLWDECGRGRLENFHTYWLRRLLTATDGWDRLRTYRARHPWFARFTSNTNAALLTRPARKLAAYGCFLVFESWVAPHFVAVLGAMDRLGIVDDDIRIYFSAHVKIDPRHSQELADGLRMQRPELSADELRKVVYGAHLAASAGKRQFDHMLDHLRDLPIQERVR
ncbi:iron-containing redox enzyme family protein [Kutzneria sp. CA-103260]|uniref:iron-containing redox enzyme family protein n=1 Tax=Kutzneria sp. CA-103260 TaxID=2802641 RepID=UPI001BA57A30|nr:iron-containing redox enzyme family protein [Kutzneria sp. CA-103260]QUQ64762.1 Iron-containing redox enzyme [Kutzneria sp. CA-103260]